MGDERNNLSVKSKESEERVDRLKICNCLEFKGVANGVEVSQV